MFIIIIIINIFKRKGNIDDMVSKISIIIWFIKKYIYFKLFLNKQWFFKFGESKPTFPSKISCKVVICYNIII